MQVKHNAGLLNLKQYHSRSVWTIQKTFLGGGGGGFLIFSCEI